jgi:4-amino-4-deoxy-L-arabinose transferase-like glycosyltransferase
MTTSLAASPRARAARPGRDARRRAAWAVVGLILVALAVRVPGLGATNLWLDEANSWSLAKYSLPALLANIRSSPGSPLYFVLLNFWVRAFGDSERALRSLSLVVSLALIPATYTLGARTVSRRAAFLGTLLLAVSPMQLYYAQEARVYMLVALLSTCTVVAYVAWRQAVCGPDTTVTDGSTTRSWPGTALVAFVVCAILSVYTLNLVVFALLALNIDAALAGVRVLRTRRAAFGTVSSRSPAYQSGASHALTAGRGLWHTARGWALAQVVVGLACLPLALAVDFKTAASTQAWRRALGVPDATRGLLDFFASTIHGGYLYPWDLYHAFVDRWGAGAVLERTLAYPLTLLVVLTALSYPPRHARSGPARVLYLVLAVPLLAGVAVSVSHELSLPRYFLFTTPCVYVLIGAGVARMAGWLRAACLVVLLATMGIGVTTYHRVGSRDSDYRPVAHRLADSLRLGDAVLIQPPEMGVPLSYYLRAHPVPIIGLTAGAPIRGALTPAAGKRTWIVLDYRSGAFGGGADSIARILPGHVVSDVVETPGGSGVRIIEVDSAVPAGKASS